MKKIHHNGVIFLGAIYAAFVSAAVFTTAVSCSLEWPEEVKIKGNPGVYAPAGNPFEGRPDFSVQKQLDNEKILDMVNPKRDPAGMFVYPYNPANGGGNSPAAQRYILSYHITTMELDVDGIMRQINDSDEGLRNLAERIRLTPIDVPEMPEQPGIPLTIPNPGPAPLPAGSSVPVPSQTITIAIPQEMVNAVIGAGRLKITSNYLDCSSFTV
ncbi:MAG: hypothetical protein LBG74_05340, partial [Spirochaetaceae bacterium]|nr:hypothetical protein [Spirochaetaceae bacterium]